MNQNRIRRTATKRSPQFFIRRSDIAFDDRVLYIESVCATLIESRFGPGRVEPVVIELSDEAEPRDAVFYDLCEGEPDGIVPCYALSPHGRAGFQVVEAAYRRAKEMGFVHAASQGGTVTSNYSPNLGRGSP